MKYTPKRLLRGAVTILFDHDGMDIEVHDRVAGIIILQARLNKDQTLQALSRLGYTNAKVTVYNLQRVGMVHKMKGLKFPISKKIYKMYGKEQDRALDAECAKHVPAGWEADMHWNVQGATSRDKSGQCWAYTNTRQWVPPRTIKRRSTRREGVQLKRKIKRRDK